MASTPPSRVNNLATALPFGIGLADEDEFSKRLEAMELSADRTNAAVLANKVDSLVGMMQQLHVTTRDNNAILNQMLFSLEERINARIDLVREELVDLINSKLNFSHVTPSSTFENPRPKSVAPEKPPARRPTLMKIFEGIESMNPDTSTAASVSYESYKVKPIPGFVIKTRKLLGNKDKVFINVFHHESIDLEPLSPLPKSNADNRPYLVIGESSNALDKDGHNCSIFNVAVSSEYFKPDSKLDFKITAPNSIQKIIHKLNIKFNEFLDESSYVLPRSSAGFKGDSVPEFDVMVVSRSSTPNQNPRPTWGSSSNVYASTSAFDRKGFPSDYDMNTRDSDSVISELTMDPQPQSANSSAPKKPRSFYDMVGFDGGGAAASKWETESNHSTATGIAVGKATITPGSAKKKLARKSFFDTSQLAMNEGTVVGRNLLSSEMLEFVKELSVDNQSAEAIRQASVEDPNILLGWQISLVEPQGKSEIFVITGVRKNYLSKTEFRVSRFGVEDQWVRLRRMDGKSGLEFRPMRKVLQGLVENGTTDP